MRRQIFYGGCTKKNINIQIYAIKIHERLQLTQFLEGHVGYLGLLRGVHQNAILARRHPEEVFAGFAARTYVFSNAHRWQAAVEAQFLVQRHGIQQFFFRRWRCVFIFHEREAATFQDRDGAIDLLQGKAPVAP